MRLININLVVEDPLSDSVARKLIASIESKKYQVSTSYQLSAPQLMQKVKGFNAASKVIPYFCLTDLDRLQCPSSLINQWLPHGQSQNFIFRVAIREIEAWLLADSQSFSTFLGISALHIPSDVEGLEDPKRTLINLVRKSKRRDIKEDIIPLPHTTSKVGRNYNGRLIQFVLEHWNLEQAMQNCPSLKRAFEALQNFEGE